MAETKKYSGVLVGSVTDSAILLSIVNFRLKRPSNLHFFTSVTFPTETYVHYFFLYTILFYFVFILFNFKRKFYLMNE